MTDFCFSAFMDYDILKKLGGDTMAKILAVDDEPAILEMIESILNKDGHLVTKVSNPLKINMEL